MALDAQQNWNVSMAENFDQIMNRSDARQHEGQYDLAKHVQNSLHVTPSKSVELPPWNGPPVYLPDEVIIEIVNHVARSDRAQYALAACCLLSHQWYSAAVPLLYSRPFLQARNFAEFSRTICPSKNLHIRKSPLSELVHELDMGRLVHHGSNSVTARLLGRTKKTLEVFVAPTATFATVCLPPLSKCWRLRCLDLSLVSQSPSLPDLLKAAATLKHLTVFRLPRSSSFEQTLAASSLPWPPNLENLTLSGRIDNRFFLDCIPLPLSLRSLTIEYCPIAKGAWIDMFLQTSVRCLPCLDTLKLRNLPRVSSRALNGVIPLLPGLKNLSISVDYISDAAFDIFDVYDYETGNLVPQLVDPESYNWNASPLHAYPPTRKCCLRFLELTHSGSADVVDKLSPWAVESAVSRGALRNLRQVRVTKSLQWHDDATVDATDDLSREMKAAALEERMGDVVDDREMQVGVWVFDGQNSYLP